MKASDFKLGRELIGVIQRHSKPQNEQPEVQAVPIKPQPTGFLTRCNSSKS